LRGSVYIIGTVPGVSEADFRPPAPVSIQSFGVRLVIRIIVGIVIGIIIRIVTEALCQIKQRAALRGRLETPAAGLETGKIRRI
jgi:capsular polysaccharide biosynthesis protein